MLETTVNRHADCGFLEVLSEVVFVCVVVVVVDVDVYGKKRSLPGQAFGSFPPVSQSASSGGKTPQSGSA